MVVGHGSLVEEAVVQQVLITRETGQTERLEEACDRGSVIVDPELLIHVKV